MLLQVRYKMTPDKLSTLKEEFPPVSQFSAAFRVSSYALCVGFIEINAASGTKVMVLRDYCTDFDIFWCKCMSHLDDNSIARVFTTPISTLATN